MTATTKVLASGHWLVQEEQATMAANDNNSSSSKKNENDADNNHESNNNVVLVTTRIHHPAFSVGDVVEVQPRTWAGINRPGGIGKVSAVHCAAGGGGGAIESLDVKYTVSSGFDRNLDPDLVRPYREVDRGSRRGRCRNRPQQEQKDEQQKQQPTAAAAAEQQHPPKDKENRERAAPPAATKQRRGRVPLRQSKKTKEAKKKTAAAKRRDQKQQAQAVVEAPPAFPEGLESTKPSGRPLPSGLPQEICFSSPADYDGEDDDDNRTCISELADPEQEVLKQRRQYSESLLALPETSAAAAGGGRSNSGSGRKLGLLANIRRKCSSPTSSSPTSGSPRSGISSAEQRCGSGRAAPARTMSIGSGGFQPSPPAAAATKKKKDAAAFSPSALKSLAVGKYNKQGKRKAEESSLRNLDTASSPSRRRAEATAAAAAGEDVMEQVYVDDQKRANEFVEEVVDNHQNNSHPPPETRDDTSVASSLSIVHDQQQEQGAASSPSPQLSVQVLQRNAFVSLFNGLLQRNDGEMEEGAILAAINRLPSEFEYEKGQAEGYLEYLCHENKIMRSDGWVYGI